MRTGQALRSTTLAFAVPAALTLAFAMAACGSSGSSGSGGGGSSSSTTTAQMSSSTTTTSSSVGGADGGDPTPADSCTKPGDHGNAKGVGEYCTPGGGECAKFAEAGLCLADVGQTQWFCTRIGCTKDDECGAATTCVMRPEGAGCVPNKCLGGGLDGGSPDGG